MEKKGLRREKRWLCEKPRTGATMFLSGMHQERMAEVDRASLACRHDLVPRTSFGKALPGGKLSRSQAVLADRSKHPCDIKMRTDANTSRRVIVANVREKKQH